MENKIEQLNFSNSGDDLIYAILNRMQVEDLHSLSFTCKRMQKMAKETFYRLHHQKFWLSIWNVSIQIKCIMGYSDEKLGTYQRVFLANFKKSVPNISLSLPADDNEIRIIFEYVKSTCCDNIETLNLSSGFKLKPNAAELIKDQLKSVKKLTVADPDAECDIFDGLMKYCENLENFEISGCTDRSMSWLLNRSEKLKTMFVRFKSIQYTFVTRPDEERFANFFSRNALIEDITTDNSEFARIALRNLKNIKRLVVSFDEFDDGFIDDLKMYRRQSDVIEEFVIYCSDNFPYKKLKIINSLSPIRCMSMRVDPRQLESLVVLDKVNQIKCLTVLFKTDRHSLHPKDISVFDLFSEIHSNLEELVLCHEDRYHATAFKFKDILMPLIKNCPKLRKMFFIFDFELQPNDLIELNEARLVVKDAVPIIISIEDMMAYELEILKQPDSHRMITITNERISFDPKFQL